MSFLGYGAAQACHFIDSNDDWIARHCDPVLFPDAYDQMGLIFWLGMGAAAILMIVLIRKLTFSAFEP